jgi:hypothetical protein
MYPPWIQQEHLGNTASHYPSQMFNINEHLHYSLQPDNHNNANHNEYNDDEDEEDSESDEEEEEDEDSDEEESESDDDEDKTPELSSYEKIIVSDDDDNANGVKIISLNVVDNLTNEYEVNTINIVEPSYDIDDAYELPMQDTQIDYSQVVSEEGEEPTIVVLKIDNNENEHVDTIVEKSTTKDLYKKMTLSNLKATVIAKGLCSDPSKMKKNELLKLLEDE